jgi:two-component system sensor histidine kinase/response regulator
LSNAGYGWFETSHRVHNSGEPYAEIPIIAVTANALSSDQARCLQVRMNNYLSNPFQLDDLRGKLQDWLVH